MEAWRKQVPKSYHGHIKELGRVAVYDLIQEKKFSKRNFFDWLDQKAWDTANRVLEEDMWTLRLEEGKETWSLADSLEEGTHAKEGLHELVDQPADPTIPAIYVGDFNLHHDLWSQEGYVNSASHDANDIEIMNRHNIITRRGCTGQRDSIIDLMMVNQKAWNDNLVMDWECERERSFGLDHNGTMFDITIPTHTPYQPEPNTWCYTIDASRKDDWLTAFASKLQSRPTPESYDSHEDCQEGALAILEAMS
ncbi:hypothetical protein FRC06_008669, partial [Ceratobasidium sp. 370]